MGGPEIPQGAEPVPAQFKENLLNHVIGFIRRATATQRTNYRARDNTVNLLNELLPPARLSRIQTARERLRNIRWFTDIHFGLRV